MLSSMAKTNAKLTRKVYVIGVGMTKVNFDIFFTLLKILILILSLRNLEGEMILTILIWLKKVLEKLLRMLQSLIKISNKPSLVTSMVFKQ